MRDAAGGRHQAAEMGAEVALSVFVINERLDFNGRAETGWIFEPLRDRS